MADGAHGHRSEAGMSKPTVLSLFSGIGGFDLGLERAGFEVVAQCDNDPFCNKVLAHHWPGVKRYDDVRNIRLGRDEHHLSREQDDAKAGATDAARGRANVGIGLREPFCEERTGSAVAGSAASEGAVGRNGERRLSASPVDLIVGGFPCQDLSVAGKRAGLDGARSGLWFEFHRILSELRPTACVIENVPGLLSSNSGRDFGVILAGLEQLWPGRWGWAVLDSQHFGVAQRRRRLYVIAGPRRERIAQILSLCEGGDWHSQKGRAAGEDVAGPVSGGAYGSGRRSEDDPNLVLANTIGAHHHRYDLDNETYIPTVDNDIAHTLSADGFDASEDGTERGTPLTVIQDARGVRNKAQNGIGIQQSETMYTLDGTSQHAVHTASVRRLTPTECERLQGFPDGWTAMPGAKDGPRYKALGNAVTVPVVEYLGVRLREVLS